VVVVSAFEDVVNQRLLRARREEWLSALDRAYRFEEVGVGLLLEHVTRSPTDCIVENI